MRTTFDPAELSERVQALEQEMGAPGFWEDQERAAAVSAEHARTSRRLSTYKELERDEYSLDQLLAELPELLAIEVRKRRRHVTLEVNCFAVIGWRLRKNVRSETKLPHITLRRNLC